MNQIKDKLLIIKKFITNLEKYNQNLIKNQFYCI